MFVLPESLLNTKKNVISMSISKEPKMELVESCFDAGSVCILRRAGYDNTISPPEGTRIRRNSPFAYQSSGTPLPDWDKDTKSAAEVAR
jgi:hypothetical protein